MSDEVRLKSIRADLQRAPTIVYLEGRTDPPVFFALLGRECPKSSVHNDVYVVGLTQGSGGQEVRARVEAATREGLSGTPPVPMSCETAPSGNVCADGRRMDPRPCPSQPQFLDLKARRRASAASVRSA